MLPMRLVAAAGLVSLAAWSVAAGGPTMNVELACGALRHAADELVVALPDSVRCVTVSVTPPSATMARVAVEAALMERGVTVSAAGDVARLNVAVRRVAVTVPAIHRRLLVGGRHAERRAEAALTAHLATPGGLTVWTAEAQATGSDNVPAAALSWTDGPAAYGCSPAVPGERWMQVAEPAIVMGSVAAILYLFFTQ